MIKRLFSGEQKDPANPRLLQAMGRIGEADGAAARQALYQELLNCTLLIPSAESDPTLAEVGRWKTLPKDIDVNLITVRDGEGDTAMLAFTDADALRAWRPEGSAYYALRGPVLFAMALDSAVDAIWLSPAGPVAGKITHRELAMLVRGPDEVTRALRWMEADAALQQGAKLYVRAPEVLPSETLVDYVRRSLRPHREVSEVYIFQSVIGDTHPHLTIGVRFGEPVAKERLQEIAPATVKGAQDLIAPDEIIDLIVLDQDDLLQGVRNKVGPIFRR